MLLPKFHYHEPKDLNEACEVMAELGEKAAILAGGTDLIVNMKEKLIVPPENVVSLARIEELTAMSNNGEWRLGACRTVAYLTQCRNIAENFAALRDGAAVLGSPLVRNRATIGGNIASARPAGDLSPALMVHDAHIVLQSKSGQRTVPLHQYFTGVGKSVMKPEEILTQIVIKKPPAGSGSGYIKLAQRKMLEISVVGVASYLSLDDQGNIAKARVTLSAVAPTPIRSNSAEQMLQGEKPGEQLFARAGEAATGDCKPIDNFRGSAEYRRDMVEALTLKTLHMAWQKARG